MLYLRKTHVTLTIAVLLAIAYDLKAKDSLRLSLFHLPDLVFEQIETADGYQASYKLLIRQPLDHNNPGSGSFYQKVYLNHRDFRSPVVLVTEGYDRSANRLYELSEFAGANQLTVEHRYYGESVPDSMDYTYLTLEQATADLHRINTLFRTVYKGPFMSTGISKGGMTTLYYRYFHPDDVQVSVPYVAPINLAYKDKRIYTFLETVGSPECRQRIIDVQRHMLENRDTYIPLLKWWARGKDYSFDRLGIEKAYEYMVLEFSFSFWQLGHSCESIPSFDVSTDSMLTFFIDVSSIGFFSDQTIDGYKPFYYQMATEMGYYGFETKHFAGLIEALDAEPSALFPPVEATVVYDSTMTLEAHQFFTQALEGVVYINGASDTWSATGVHPDPSLDALTYYLKDLDHRKARIKSMTREQQLELEAYLERYLKYDIPGVVSFPGKS